MDDRQPRQRGGVVSVAGPLVVARLPTAVMGSQVEVGADRIVGEVIRLRGDEATVQMYESTELVRPGDVIESAGQLLSVELGPGLLGTVFDGIQRPLDALRALSGDRIRRGVSPAPLDRRREWRFAPRMNAGEHVRGGEVLGTVRETELLEHRVLVPPEVQGELTYVAGAGGYSVEAAIARVGSGRSQSELRLFHRWPVRKARPVRERLMPVEPLLTGQRVLDMLFPLAKGGTAAVPGPFGAGKTILQHQLARWCDAGVIVFVGCGERGNEMVDVLEQFGRLTDPRTGRLLLERSVLIANTSNMPVTAREASIYTGITIAEYFRDQGYDVALMADSTSRWAEALREVAGRLEELPAEEGYPAYLGSRLAAFYERAGLVRTLSGAAGSVTVIGSVSPPGGDFSEPVTRHTQGIVRAFWGLSKPLADARHYPAVDWDQSFSDYAAGLASWWSERVPDHWADKRREMLHVLHDSEEAVEEISTWTARRRDALDVLRQADELRRIASIIGPAALSDRQQWTFFAAALIKDGFLQQDALHPVDTYCAPEKQLVLFDLVMWVHDRGRAIVDRGIPCRELVGLPGLTRLKRARVEIPNDRVDALGELRAELERQFAALG